MFLHNFILILSVVLFFVGFAVAAIGPLMALLNDAFEHSRYTYTLRVILTIVLILIGTLIMALGTSMNPAFILEKKHHVEATE